VPRCPDDPNQPVPIGTACDGEELLVLNEAMRPVAPGTIGDLYIGGVGLARGYWGDAARTASAFVDHPERPSERLYKTGDLACVGPGGHVYFHGRNDFQIKSRGYRIELGEIEAAAHAVPGVQQCVVTAVNGGGFETAVICCAYVPEPGAEITPSSLRRRLAERVPAYMLPGRWLAFDHFPENANGKVDRPRVKAIFEERFEPHAAEAAQFA
jgi:acyl-coenzyme A synthetase/AMP-(fatty) acid ligase